MNDNARPRYRVVTVIQPPFVMYNDTARTFHGYCIDLLNDIKSLVGFDYDIRESFDGQYGVLSPFAKWNGAIYELQTNRSDIFVGAMWPDLLREYAVSAQHPRNPWTTRTSMDALDAPLHTANVRPRMVVDFTIPFYRENGFTVMMPKPEVHVPFLKFLAILEYDVWCGFALSFILTSILLYVYERYSPTSRRNNRQEDEPPTEDDRFASLKECFWFTATSITPQGGGNTPQNFSGKLAATTWWLFAFIIVATYTANLAGYETLDRLEKYIESLDDLVDQYQVEYSTLENSSTHRYFRRMLNVEELFRGIWENMSLDESLTDWERSQFTIWDYPVPTRYAKIMTSMDTAGFFASTEDVMKALRKENRTREFAFVGTAMLIRYLMLTNCGFREVGKEFSKKPYAFAVQKGSPLKDKFDEALTNLMIRRRLNELEKKWWDENPERVFCTPDREVNAGFGLAYMGAVFLLIFVGILLAVLMFILEYYWFRCGSEMERYTAILLKKMKKEQNTADVLTVIERPQEDQAMKNTLRHRLFSCVN